MTVDDFNKSLKTAKGFGLGATIGVWRIDAVKNVNVAEHVYSNGAHDFPLRSGDLIVSGVLGVTIKGSEPLLVPFGNIALNVMESPGNDIFFFPKEKKPLSKIVAEAFESETFSAMAVLTKLGKLPLVQKSNVPSSAIKYAYVQRAVRLASQTKTAGAGETWARRLGDIGFEYRNETLKCAERILKDEGAKDVKIGGSNVVACTVAGQVYKIQFSGPYPTGMVVDLNYPGNKKGPYTMNIYSLSPEQCAAEALYEHHGKGGFIPMQGFKKSKTSAGGPMDGVRSEEAFKARRWLKISQQAMRDVPVQAAFEFSNKARKLRDRLEKEFEEDGGDHEADTDDVRQLRMFCGEAQAKLNDLLGIGLLESADKARAIKLVKAFETTAPQIRAGMSLGMAETISVAVLNVAWVIREKANRAAEMAPFYTKVVDFIQANSRMPTLNEQHGWVVRFAKNMHDVKEKGPKYTTNEKMDKARDPHARALSQGQYKPQTVPSKKYKDPKHKEQY